MLKIPSGSNFKMEIAQELLLLVEYAHKEFDTSTADKRWKWDDDRSPIPNNRIPMPIRNKEYEVKTRFGFAEYDYLITSLKPNFRDIMGKKIQEIGGIGRKRVPFGFVAYNQEANAVYVVFRGTMTPAEWITNFQFKPGCEPFLNKKDLGEVHRGFHKIYTRKDIGDNVVDPKDDRPSIQDCLEKAITGCTANAIGQWPSQGIIKCPKDAQVYVTGHSLGGALATLATLHIKEINYFNSSPILYSFANPRAGGQQFAERFNGLECFRVANSEDIVPTVPLASVDLKANQTNDTTSKSLEETKKLTSLFSPLLPDLDYHHIGEPIYFTNHKGAIADNHIILAYKEALGLQ
jgi:hypothetical protein